MAQLLTDRLVVLEEGGFKYKLPAKNAEVACPKRSIFQIVLNMILFNLTLVALIYLLFMYMGSVDEQERRRVTDAFYVIAGILGFYLLYRAGDASENNPHFYYI